MVRAWMVVGVGFGLAVSLACGGGGDAFEPVAVTVTPPPAGLEEAVTEPVAEAAQVVEAVTIADPIADPIPPRVAPIVSAETTATVASVVEAEPTDKLDHPVEEAPAPVPTPAPAAVGPGQIQLTTNAGIQPSVDGVPMRLTENQGFMAEVSQGKHNLEIRNLLGRVTGSTEVDVVGGRRIRYEWRQRQLTMLGEVEASTMPAAIDWEEVLATEPEPVDDGKGPMVPASSVKK